MQVIDLDLGQEIPLIAALIRGRLGRKRVKLVFDTGCGITQIDTQLIEALGYSVRDATEIVSVRGPAGDRQEGYLINISELEIFGQSFVNTQVAVYDFDNFSHYGIDGLLGWNVIKNLHLEMNGPEAKLTVYKCA